LKRTHLRRLSFLTFAFAALAASLALTAACGDDDSTSAKATQPAASASAPATVAAAYPLKITDMAKRSVEIKQKPAVVVAVSPTAVELVYAAGGTVVGRSSSVDFPDAAKAATDVGSAYNPSPEKILALKPDLVIGDSVIIKGVPAIQKMLDGLGVPVLYVGAESYADVIAGLDLMGKVFNAPEKTDAVKAGIEKAKNDAKAALAGKNVSVVAITADEKTQLYAAKDSSYPGDILKEVGVKNPANPLPDTPPFPGYALLAPEKMLEMNPDFILAIKPDPRAPALAGVIKGIPPFKGLKAVAGNHVLDGDVEVFLQAPGPRIADAFRLIADALKGQ
jgi:iron complex transport system substrate-binding protein